MVEKINYKQNATNVYNVLVDSIENKINELKENIEKLASETNKNNEKNLVRLEEQVKVQEELCTKINKAKKYLNNSQIEDIGKISEYIEKARDSISTSEDLIDEKEHKEIAEYLLSVQNLFNSENQIQKEISDLENSTKKFIKTNGIEKQELKVTINGEETTEKMSWGIKRFFTDLSLSIYDIKRKLEEDNVIEDPVYSDLILNDLELIGHYRKMLEEERISKVLEIKQPKQLFSNQVKSKDETGEFELRKANEYYKIKVAVVSVAKLIIELGYQEEFKKTVEKLKEIEKYCGDKFNQNIDVFEKSNFIEVKTIVSEELDKDRKENEIIELQNLYKEAYKKIGKEHERLINIAKKYAIDHLIPEDIQTTVEENGKNDAINQMMVGGKIESAEEFKNFLKESDESKNSKNSKLSQDDFEEEIRRRKEERENAQKDNNDVMNELNDIELKQSKFEEFMMKKRNAKKVGEFSLQSIDEDTINEIEFESPEEEKKGFEVFTFELPETEQEEEVHSRRAA